MAAPRAMSEEQWRMMIITPLTLIAQETGNVSSVCFRSSFFDHGLLILIKEPRR